MKKLQVPVRELPGKRGEIMASNAWSRGGRTETPITGTSTPAASERATIGSSVVIKGDVSGTEPLFIDGRVEGSITFPSHRVTVGRTSRIHADIRAHDVVVMGSVEGNIYCEDLLDIRADGLIHGHMSAQRIQIDDGAILRGNVEVNSVKKSAEAQAAFTKAEQNNDVRAIDSKEPREKDPDEAFRDSLLEAAASVSIAGGQPARRAHGSHVLIEPTR
jgi:cytoskeletal protein CcmA (bactofilin family)